MFRQITENEKALAAMIDSTVKNKWNWKWLEEDVCTTVTLSRGKETICRGVKIRLGDSIRKINQPGQAICTWCNDTIKYGTKGKVALKNHMIVEKHLMRVKTRLASETLGSLMKTDQSVEQPVFSNPVKPALDADQTSSTESHDVEQPKEIVSLEDRVAYQEAAVLAVLVEQSWPFSAAPVLINLAKSLASDPEALNQLSIDYTAASYEMRLKKHKHKKRKHEESSMGESSSTTTSQNKEDTQVHGGWWEIKCFEDIIGNVAFEIGDQTYISALDNGLLTLGPPRSHGEAPDPTEIFTVLKLSETKVAFKSGYGKYLSVDTERRVVGRSEAIGNREQFEPVFQDGKMALNGCNSCFVSADDDGDVVCSSSTAGEEQMIKLRCNLCLEEDPKEKMPREERGSIKDAEINYVKKFQSFQDRRLRVNQNDRGELKDAKKEGYLHEKLLDRREKMKADRYCK